MAGKHFPTVEIHASAHSARAGTLRVWVGIFDEAEPTALEWFVDQKRLGSEHVASVRELTYVAPGPPRIRTQTGVFDLTLPVVSEALDGSSAGDSAVSGDRRLREVGLTVRWGRRSATATPLWTRPLPSEVPTGFERSFRVLLVSCFYQPKDRDGFAGLVAAMLARNRRPDLVLTVGDQVYLDVKPLDWGLVLGRYAKTFHDKYRLNWQTAVHNHGYANILRAGPVAAIPDDHEFWNNYPMRGWLGPHKEASQRSWDKAAHDMYDAFQLGSSELDPSAYTYEIDVAPLSFFMMDNRSFRTTVTTGSSTEVVSMLGSHRLRYRSWVQRMIDTRDAVPVLVTGPSLLQGPSEKPKQDLNFADVMEYPEVMAGLLAMSEAGCSPLILTGDVHYPRVTRAQPQAGNPKNPWGAIHEVISSPASIVLAQHDKPVAPAEPQFEIGAGHGMKLGCSRLFPKNHSQLVGNHLVELEFTRRATGIQLMVRYWPTRTKGPDQGGCYQVGPISLERTPASGRAPAGTGSGSQAPSRQLAHFFVAPTLIPGTIRETSSWAPPLPTRVRDPAPVLTIADPKPEGP